MTSNSIPLKFVSCGKFVSNRQWTHERRVLNTFVLLIGYEGTLYIESNGQQYEMEKGSFVLLLPNIEHRGYRICNPGLSYYWCHFSSRDNQIDLLDETERTRQVILMKNNQNKGGSSNVFLLPEFGVVNTSERIMILFRQLLDFAFSDFYTDYVKDYTLSLLAMEISHLCIDNNGRLPQAYVKSDSRLSEIKEWIRINYGQHITVREVADKYSYNPNYLSSVFKEETGHSLLQYIHRVKITAARILLLNPSFTVYQVANFTGFDDEKHFMKTFKKLEGVTPTQYRNAFNQTHLNNH